MVFLKALYQLFLDMGFYLMIGLAFIAILNIVIKKEWIAKHLGKNNLWDSIKASLFGVPLPLCSCGVVPSALYLKEQGASTATVISFLISTPQTGVDSILATFGMMGLTFAWYRPLAAFISGVTGGTLVGAVAGNDDKPLPQSENGNLEEDYEGAVCPATGGDNKLSLKDKIIASIRYAFGEFLGGITVHFVIGLIIAALISVLLPESLIAELGLGSGILTMLLMIVIGLPMYICSTSSIPIALTLMAKGISPGAAFVFLFVGPLTNAASLAMIGKKLGKKITALYVAVSAVLAMAFGLILDGILSRFDLPIKTEIGQHHMDTFGIIKWIVAAIFFVLIVYHLGRILVGKLRDRSRRQGGDSMAMKRAYIVQGMTCQNCVRHAKDALYQLPQVKQVEIDLEEKTATVWGDVAPSKVVEAIHKAGYTAKEKD